MKDYWRWVERGVWFLGLAYVVIQWRVDVTDMKGDLQTLKENDAKQEERWENQLSLNGQLYVVSKLVIDGAGAEED